MTNNRSVRRAFAASIVLILTTGGLWFFTRDAPSSSTLAQRLAAQLIRDEPDAARKTGDDLEAIGCTAVVGLPLANLGGKPLRVVRRIFERAMAEHGAE